MLRDHIGYKDFGIVIVVDIGHIGTHGCSRGAVHHICECLPECTISIVHVDIVPLKEIVGDIDIHPPVLVNISNGNTQSEPNEAGIDPCLFTRIGKMIVVVTEQFVAPNGIPYQALI